MDLASAPAFFSHFRAKLDWLSSETHELQVAVSRAPLSSAEGGYARSSLERELMSTIGELKSRTQALRDGLRVASAVKLTSDAIQVYNNNEVLLNTLEDALEPYGYTKLPPKPASDTFVTSSSESAGDAVQEQGVYEQAVLGSSPHAPGAQTQETSPVPADQLPCESVGDITSPAGLDIHSLGLSAHAMRLVAGDVSPLRQSASAPAPSSPRAMESSKVLSPALDLAMGRGHTEPVSHGEPDFAPPDMSPMRTTALV